MSGPKYSRPRLTAAERRRQEENRKRRIEEERRRREEDRKRRIEEERRRKEEQKMKELDIKIEQSVLRLNQVKQSIELAGTSLIEDALKVLGEHPSVEVVRSQKQQALLKINEFPKIHKERMLSTMQSYQQSLEQLINTSSQFVENDLAVSLGKLKDNIKDKKLMDAEKNFIDQSRSLKVKAQSNLDLSLDGSEKKESEEISIDEQWRFFNEVLTHYLESNHLTSKYKDEIHEFYSGTNLIVSSQTVGKQYITSQLDQRLKAFLTTKSRYDEEIRTSKNFEQQYDSLFTTYQILCDMLNEESVKQPFLVEEATLQIKTLKENIAELEKQLSEKEEADYIANSVNEIMTSLGYEVVSSEIMQTPKRRIVQQLYDFGENSVINVSSSDDGSLLFQVTGISDGPKREASSLEKLKITEDMDRFCEKYPFVKEELHKKGIELTNEDLKPTSEEYVGFIDLSKKKDVRRVSKSQSIVQKNSIHKQRLE